MKAIAKLHEHMGLDVQRIRLVDGAEREDAFLLSGVFIRTVSRLRALAALLFGRVRGALVVDRGAVKGEPRAPVVLLDWETYCRMVVGLRAEKLPDLLQPLSESDEWRRETGGSFQ